MGVVSPTQPPFSLPSSLSDGYLDASVFLGSPYPFPDFSV